ncbi:MAG TPA: hypothetical protein VKZ63_15450 [Kofleriaceae bacterium]|nr:hypothetical protein [Kofleriaceae bacterium]
MPANARLDTVRDQDDELLLPDPDPTDEVVLIGHDDPTIKTTALPDTGVDSAVHDLRHIQAE